MTESHLIITSNKPTKRVQNQKLYFEIAAAFGCNDEIQIKHKTVPRRVEESESSERTEINSVTIFKI